MKLKLTLILISFLLLTNYSYAFSFKRTPKKPKAKMVETVEQWKKKAQDVPLSQRHIENPQPPKTNKKMYYPEPKYIFEKYNYPQGQHELDLTRLKKDLILYPITVADLDCHYVAYPIYHYRADMDQVSSEFYIGNLDTKKTKTKRILDYNHANGDNYPVLEVGMYEAYPRLFRGLTLVDWSHDSNKILIKERVGSTIGGNYMTYIYVHFLDTKQTIKLEKINKALIEYFIDSEAIVLSNYKYEIEPLGFSLDDDNVIIYHCFVYNNDGEKIFLGTWGYDLAKNQVLLFSRTNPASSVGINGIVLKRIL